MAHWSNTERRWVASQADIDDLAIRAKKWVMRAEDGQPMYDAVEVDGRVAMGLLAERDALRARVAELEQRNRHQKRQNGNLQAAYDKVATEARVLAERLANREARVAELEREREAAYERGRSAGREDVAKYSRAIGEIEAVLGIAGAVPLSETVAAVRAMADENKHLNEHAADISVDAYGDGFAAGRADERAAVAAWLRSRPRSPRLPEAIERGEHIQAAGEAGKERCDG